MKKFLVRILCCFIPSSNYRHKIRRKLLNKPLPWLGRHSYIRGSYAISHKDTVVGAFCSIGTNVSLGPSQHPSNFLSTHPFQYCPDYDVVPDEKLYKYSFEPVIVGNDVWIGNNVIIKDGVKIADGCIIGSNAVVTHDTEPYAIMGGVPARVIRYRFPTKTIQELLKLKWWDLPDDEIAKLPFDDIDQCIKKLKIIRKKYPVSNHQVKQPK